MKDDFKKENSDLEVEEVKDVEFTEEESKSHIRLYENDIISGLLAAADYRTEEKQHIEIARNGTLYFEFDIRALSEYEYDKCKTKHTKYVRNKSLGIKLPEETNTAKYRCALIYEATVESDRNNLWDNRKVWNTLNQKGFQIMNGLDVIENVLKSGEKDKVVECIDKLSGYDDNNLEEVTKN